MARPIDYTPQAPKPDVAHDEALRLLQVLHERGVLRLVEGLVGKFDSVAQLGVEQLDTPAGRRGLLNAVVLGKALTSLDSDSLRAVVAGTTRGLSAAQATLREAPPSTFRLIKRLTHPDTRRGLSAVLTLLATLGRELAHHEEALVRKGEARP